MKKLSWALVLVAFACSKKEEKPADKPGPLPMPQVPAAAARPKHADTSPLWAMAPADATAGIVIGDGVLGRLVEATNGLLKDAEGKAWAKKVLDQIAAERKQAPFDFLDPKAWSAVGADAGKGVAVFFGGQDDDPLIIVLPITNREALRQKLEGKVEKLGDRDVDSFGTKGRCADSAGRYVCAETMEVLDAALKPHDAPLVAAVKALPAEARGDLEFYADVTKMPAAQRDLATSPFKSTTTGGGAIRFEPDGLTVRVWGKGDYGELAKQYGSAAPPAELTAMTAGAQTVIRWKFDTAAIAAQVPASLPAGDVDMRADLIDQLTGDVQMVTAGKGLLGGALQAKVKDTARVKKAIGAMCNELKGQQIPNVTNVKVDENGCSAEIDIRQELEDVPPIRVGVSLSGSLLLVTMGDVDAGSLKGSMAPDVISAEAKEITSGAQTMAAWSRSLDIDVGALPKKLTAALASEAEASEIVTAVNWFAAQVGEVAFGANVTASGAQFVARVVTYAGDPPEARTAYHAALDKRAAGDRAGYLAALDEIEKKHGSSLLARRAKLERAGRAVLGPPLAAVAGGVAAFLVFRGAGGAGPSINIPGLGGSFGDPGEPGDKPAPEKPEP